MVSTALVSDHCQRYAVLLKTTLHSGENRHFQMALTLSDHPSCKSRGSFHLEGAPLCTHSSFNIRSHWTTDRSLIT